MSISHKRVKFRHEEPDRYNRNEQVDVIIADGVTELAQAAHLATEKHKHPYDGDFSRSRGEDEFYGRQIDGFNDIIAMTKEPWLKGVDVVNRMISKLQKHKLPKVKSRKRVKKWDEERGDEVDLDRLRAGQKFYRDTERVQTLSAKGVVTIISDMSANWTLSPETILWRGAASLVFTHILENAGYRVELWAATARGGVYVDPYSDALMAACIKRSHQPMNLSQIVGALSAWYYRGVGFHTSNLALDLTPGRNAGWDRDGGLKPFAHLLTTDSTVLLAQKLWSEKDAIAFIGDACEAIDRDDLTTCKWAFSPTGEKTELMGTYDRFDGTIKGIIKYHEND